MPNMVRLLAALAAAAALAGCGSVDAPSNQVSETFTGTLSPASQVSHPFSVSKTGEMTLTLNSLTPRPVLGFITMAIGDQIADTCSPIFGYIVSQAGIGQPYSFPQITKGSYCVLVADANAVLTANAAYSVQLLHP
jgi:hypothetical protein